MKTNKKILSIKEVLKSIDRYSCPFDINLHCHSYHSDGSLSPVELIKNASKLGLKHFAITDHHSIDSYHPIIDWIENNKYNDEFTIPKFWSGIEITCLLKNCLIHAIGLDFDVYSNNIKHFIDKNVRRGYKLSAEYVVDSIHQANGVCILAHPGRYRIDFMTLINEAKNIDFDGIEVWYDYERKNKWSPSLYICESIENLTFKLDMLPSCGTDTHGMSLLKR